MSEQKRDFESITLRCLSKSEKWSYMGKTTKTIVTFVLDGEQSGIDGVELSISGTKEELDHFTPGKLYRSTTVLQK